MAGLNSIKSLLSAVETVERSLMEGVYVQRAVEEKREDIVAMNVEQLYERGVNSVGVAIDSYAPYAPYTILVKQQKGQPTDRVTLRDTGEFHKSFILVIDSTGFYITATDPKTWDLVDKYGDKIFGLTPENRSSMCWGLLYPIVMKQIDSEIFRQ